MDDIDELIRSEMERLLGNDTVNSGISQPSVPPLQPLQPSPEPVPQPEKDPEVATPVDRTSQAINEPTVEIVEQPMRSRRFRYDSEIRSAGAIRGAQYTKDHKSFPTIRISNYEGPVEIRVSLVCKDAPYRVHPNGIVGKNKSTEKNNSYIYDKKIQVTWNSVVHFNDLGIRIVRPSQIADALQQRENLKVDPFGQGFSHKFDLKTNDLQAVRLCFEVKLSQERKLYPVVSDIIYHSKNPLGCLEITEMMQSGPKVIIFSQRQQLNPKDVEVVFYTYLWEKSVQNFDISDTSGIVCAVPPFPYANKECDTEVLVCLRRLSDRARGNPRPYTYYADIDAINKKKRKVAKNIVQGLLDWTLPTSLAPDNDSQYDQDWRNMPGPFDGNPTMPGPSSVNPAVPEPSFVNQAGPGPSSVNTVVSGLNHVNSAVPGPSPVNPAVPGPSFGNAAVSGLNHVHSAKSRASIVNSAVPGPSYVNTALSGLNQVNLAKPQPSHINSAVPGPTFINSAVSWSNHDNSAVPRATSVNLAMTGPSSVNAGVLGSNYIKSTVPEPGFVNSAVPGLNGANPFLPEPTKSNFTQIDQPMSPEMVTIPCIPQPMSINEDEGFFSPNGILDNDGEYPGEDWLLQMCDL